MTSVYFDHQNDEAIRTCQLKNGKTATAGDTSPATLQAHETFSAPASTWTARSP
jgi:hypothetical protein